MLLSAGPRIAAATLPAGTHIDIRLRQEINSVSTKQGSAFEGIVISPVSSEGQDLIPAGTIAKGTVGHVRKVGMGLVRERASIELNVYELVLPDGRRLPLWSKLSELDNAREAVDKKGRIQGIRSTNTPGYRATGVLVSLASVEPIAFLFSTAAFATILRFSEPEILLPAGAEFRIRLSTALETGDTFEANRPHTTSNLDERRQLMQVIKRLPYRTRTANRIDSDFTNLVFIGDLRSLQRAFEAAGWSEPETANAASRYRTLRAVAESQSYKEAPMSTLLLNGEAPVISRTKSLNSFSRRHHLRIYRTFETWKGERVTTAAATRDSGIGFSVKDRGFVHLIDTQIDHERTKVFDDLMLTGCVESSEAVGRPWMPRRARNATGDHLVTDGAVLVVRLNSCESPRRFDEQVAASPGPFRGSGMQRVLRRFILTARNDLIRGNLVYQGISYSAALARVLTKRPGKDGKNIEIADTDPNDGSQEVPARAGDPQLIASLQLPGRQSLVLPSSFNLIAPSGTRSGPIIQNLPSSRPPTPVADRRWVAPRMELGFHTGTMGYPGKTLGVEGILISRLHANGTPETSTVLANNTVRRGWQMGGTLTVNSHKWASHELGFLYQRSTYELDLGSSDSATQGSIDMHVKDRRAGLLVREFSYNTLFQLRPRDARWSPYVAAGPVLRLMHLTDAPFEKARGVFRLGLGNVGMFRAAYNFNQAPPLGGGGVFQPAVQFGGGVKVRIMPRWTLRLDFRDTISPHPDFLTKSVLTEPMMLEPGGPSRIEAMPQNRKLFQQRRFSSGFAFTF